MVNSIDLRDSKRLRDNIFPENKKSIQQMLNDINLRFNREKFINRNLPLLNISFPERFSYQEILYEVVKNRLELSQKDQRPIALVLYTKADSQGAFRFNDIASLVNRGHRVLYYEVGRDTEVYEAIEQVGRHHKINLLVIGGHGSPKCINLGAENKTTVAMNEEKYLDTSDLTEMLERNLSKYFSTNSTVILESCSTGFGGAKNWNMVNMIRTAIPVARAIGPKQDTKLGNYVFDRQNRVINENFTCGGNQIYNVGPNLPKAVPRRKK